MRSQNRSMLAALLAGSLLLAPGARAVDPNFKIYDDQFVTDPFSVIQFGLNARSTPISALTTQHHATGQALKDATQWNFSAAVGTVDDTVAQNVPATQAWTCNLPDRSDCGFDWPGIDGMLVADSSDATNVRVRSCTAIEYDDATGRLMMRAAAEGEGSASELRLCFDPAQGRPDYAIMNFQNVDGQRRFVKFGDAWSTSVFSCLPAAQQGTACGAAGGNRVSLTSAGATVAGQLTASVVNKGTVTLPSGHVMDALLVQALIEYDTWLMLAGSSCAFPNQKVATVRQFRYIWAVPYYGQVVTLTSPIDLASRAPSSWTVADSTMITYGLLPPLSVSLTGTTSTSLTVSWNPGAITKNVDGWIVHWGTQPGATVEPPFESATLPKAQNSYTITGLNPSTTYYVSVSSTKSYQDPKSGVTTLYHSIRMPNTVGADTNGDGTRDVSYPPELSAATQAPSCMKGDVHPDGVGNGNVELTDFVLGRRKVLGLAPASARDTTCGDLQPGTTVCQPAGQPASWCVTGDGNFQQGDVIAIRRVVGGVQVLSCTGCGILHPGGDPTQTPHADGEALRLPGDVAPRGNANGGVDVSDVVAALRMSVGLDTPTTEELLRGDVAPATIEGALTVVTGNGHLDVSDVVLLLRSSVGLSQLAWPVRRVTANLEDAVTYSGFHVRVTQWPASATPVGFEADPCGSLGGMDVVGDAWNIICAPDVPPTGPRELAAYLYRAPEAVNLGSLALWSLVTNEALDEITPTITLGSR